MKFVFKEIKLALNKKVVTIKSGGFLLFYTFLRLSKLRASLPFTVLSVLLFL